MFPNMAKYLGQHEDNRGGYRTLHATCNKDWACKATEVQTPTRLSREHGTPMQIFHVWAPNQGPHGCRHARARTSGGYEHTACENVGMEGTTVTYVMGFDQAVATRRDSTTTPVPKLEDSMATRRREDPADCREPISTRPGTASLAHITHTSTRHSPTSCPCRVNGVLLVALTRREWAWGDQRLEWTRRKTGTADHTMETDTS